ncbi:MAG: cysteine desulfurase [Thermomicrobiales bacterium]|nr:cysteine desulfurase [Thermomicrobiales bacterium]
MTYGRESVYLDHAATTPVDPAVVNVMLPYFTQEFGNPSSIYRSGQDAHAALDRARTQIATVLGSRTSEIIFTSGATESINLALRGAAWAARLRAPDASTPHIVSSAVEHHAVLHTLDALARQGFAITLVPVDETGRVDSADVIAAIRPETCLVSVMLANNEVGTIQPVAEIGAEVRARGIPMHTDAVQAAGSLPLNVNALNVDLLSLSAHKFYGPKGVGLLYVRKGSQLEWTQEGGGQESGRRGGTENTAYIAGLGEALARAEQGRENYVTHTAGLRDYLWRAIRDRVDDVSLNGPEPGPHRLSNNLNITIDGVQGETVLLSLDIMGIEASAGSACTTGNSEPSHVLLAMGLSEEDARASLRLTVGRGNSIDEMDRAADALAEVVDRIRMLAGR